MSKPEPLKIKRVLLSSLTEDPKNARKHNARNLESIRASLESHGQVEPLVVQASTHKVIGGNGRLATMRSMGWTHADVVEVAVDDTRAAALAITLNRTSELAEWDDEQLAETLKALQAQDFKIDLMGFDEEELRKVLVKEHERMVGDGENNAPGLGSITYRVLIECADEKQQGLLLERMEKEGFKCQLLMS